MNNPHEAYERAKANWLIAHPDATPAAIEAAFKAFAALVGV